MTLNEIAEINSIIREISNLTHQRKNLAIESTLKLYNQGASFPLTANIRKALDEEFKSLVCAKKKHLRELGVTFDEEKNN